MNIYVVSEDGPMAGFLSRIEAEQWIRKNADVFAYHPKQGSGQYDAWILVFDSETGERIAEFTVEPDAEGIQRAIR